MCQSDDKLERIERVLLRLVDENLEQSERLYSTVDYLLDQARLANALEEVAGIIGFSARQQTSSPTNEIQL